MDFVFEDRKSNSPLVESIWRTRTEHSGSFISRAASQWEMVVWWHEGKALFTVRGPETRARAVDCPADSEFLGIVFKLGTYIPHLPTSDRVDRDLVLPDATSKSFWLQGSAWEVPELEDADAFVSRLMRRGLLARDPVVEAAMQGEPHELSPRTVQRRFSHATGLTKAAVRQIERAGHAAGLLAQGVNIADVVYQAGYADQPHLTRSLKRYAGQTPAQLAGRRGPT